MLFQFQLSKRLSLSSLVQVASLLFYEASSYFLKRKEEGWIKGREREKEKRKKETLAL
jgi:hypothetical protein